MRATFGCSLGFIAGFIILRLKEHEKMFVYVHFKLTPWSSSFGKPTQNKKVFKKMVVPRDLRDDVLKGG